jgi:hypothetical protein
MQNMPLVAAFRGEGVPTYMLKVLGLIVLCFLLPAALVAQSFPSAEGRRGMTVWVGGEVSMFNPDWGCKDDSPFTCGGGQLLGFAPFVDANNLLIHRVGVEGEARILHWRGPGQGLTESSYLVGPRVGLFQLKNAIFFSGKFVVGNANITVPNHGPGDGNHLAIAPGFIGEFRLSRRLAMRGEYEYQLWPSFKGVATSTTSGTGGLTPNGFSLGVSYRLFR